MSATAVLELSLITKNETTVCVNVLIIDIFLSCRLMCVLWEAAHLSAESAVSVNTDTPTEDSWINGISLQPTRPKTHSSTR